MTTSLDHTQELQLLHHPDTKGSGQLTGRILRSRRTVRSGRYIPDTTLKVVLENAKALVRIKKGHCTELGECNATEEN
jgi:hypothetical protein